MCSELNNFFSFFVFFQLTVKVMVVISFAFCFIFTLISPSSVMDELIPQFIFLFITELIKIVIIISSADMPVIQVVSTNILTFGNN